MEKLPSCLANVFTDFQGKVRKSAIDVSPDGGSKHIDRESQRSINEALEQCIKSKPLSLSNIEKLKVFWRESIGHLLQSVAQRRVSS